MVQKYALCIVIEIFSSKYHEYFIRFFTYGSGQYTHGEQENLHPAIFRIFHKFGFRESLSYTAVHYSLAVFIRIVSQ